MVIPVVMARAGVVMNGALTELEELSPHGWNGRPVTVGHPVEENGEFHTANAPDKLKDWCVGQIFNATVEDDALKAEAWVDIEKARQVRPGLLVSLKKGGKMDVSTGFFCVDEEAKGESNGKAYDVISRNWVPDHLALLPDEEGACNWEDGCGVRSNSIRRLRMKSKSKVNKTVAGILAAVGVKNASAKRKVEKEIRALLNMRGNDEDARQIVADLISNDASPFVPDDEDSLRMMSEETLKEMRNRFLAAEGEDEKVEAMEGDEEEVVAAEDDEEVVAAEDDEEMTAAEDDEEVTAAEEDEEPKAAKKKNGKITLSQDELRKLIANEVKKASSKLLSANDRHALKTASKIAAAARKELVNKVVANTTMKRAAAEALDLPTLELFANSVHPTANYGGRLASNAEFDSEDKAMLESMVAPTTKSLIANRAKNRKDAH